jgi:hypothetical protein
MKPLKEKQIVDDSEGSPIHPSRGSAGPTTARELHTSEINGQDASSIRAAKATGPRTPAGKDRIKHNAVKHGIFSKVALLKNESRSEFDSLLNGLSADFQPKGILEEVLVEKLAILLWRLRRLFIAEVAEIENGAAFLEWDEKERQEMDAQKPLCDPLLNSDDEVVGLMQKMENPKVLGRCLDLLDELKTDIETAGFESESDEQVLTKLYGDREHWTTTLLETYRIWSATAECSDEERAENGYGSIEQCKRSVLEEIEKEILRLNQFKKAKASIESERAQLEALRKCVPDDPQLNRLLRYETNLGRDFDRTLAQLERIQRVRKGQPVLPPIKVELSPG